MRRGVLLRHLVLPSRKKDSIEILRRISKEADISRVRLSLMCQYTVTDAEKLQKYEGLSRKLTSLEYSRVLEEAQKLGYTGYMQEKNSADAGYIPEFDMRVLGEKI